MGFMSVMRWMISRQCLTMRTPVALAPPFRPWNIMHTTRRSTIGHRALAKRFFCHRPAVWGRNTASVDLDAM